MNFWIGPNKNLTAVGNLDKVLHINIVSDSIEFRDKVLTAYRKLYRLPGLLILKVGELNVKLSANSTVLNNLFKTTFVKFNNGTYGCISPPYIPEDLINHIVAIHGFETYSVFQSYVTIRNPKVPKKIDLTLDNFTKKTIKYQGITGNKMARLYKFPTISKPGDNCRIAIVGLGGTFVQKDLADYCNVCGIHPVPQINVINLPGCDLSDQAAGQELALDVQIISTICNYAKITVYNGNNSFYGFYNALQNACSENDCVSVSWGIQEKKVPSGTLNAFENLISSVKIPVCIASGDSGSDNKKVCFPACCPSAISCGGTTVTFDSKTNPTTVLGETTWSGSGGGFSNFFEKKTYQTIIPGKKNGVPDLCANADPKSGYLVYFQNTRDNIIGGTSAVAPLIASFLALCKQSSTSKRTNNSIKQNLYSLLGSDNFKDIKTGNNGDYNASKGWDPCTGLGVPNFSNLSRVLNNPDAKTLLKQSGYSNPGAVGSTPKNSIARLNGMTAIDSFSSTDCSVCDTEQTIDTCTPIAHDATDIEARVVIEIETRVGVESHCDTEVPITPIAPSATSQVAICDTDSSALVNMPIENISETKDLVNTERDADCDAGVDKVVEDIPSGIVENGNPSNDLPLGNISDTKDIVDTKSDSDYDVGVDKVVEDIPIGIVENGKPGFDLPPPLTKIKRIRHSLPESTLTVSTGNIETVNLGLDLPPPLTKIKPVRHSRSESTVTKAIGNIEDGNHGFYLSPPLTKINPIRHSLPESTVTSKPDFNMAPPKKPSEQQPPHFLPQRKTKAQSTPTQLPQIILPTEPQLSKKLLHIEEQQKNAPFKTNYKQPQDLSKTLNNRLLSPQPRDSIFSQTQLRKNPHNINSNATSKQQVEKSIESSTLLNTRKSFIVRKQKK
jgi:hypothetical protein